MRVIITLRLLGYLQLLQNGFLHLKMVSARKGIPI
jgi:hypothetical protein